MKTFLLAFAIATALVVVALWKLNDAMQIIPTHPSLTKGKAGKSTLSKAAYKNGNTRFADVQERIIPHLKEALAKKKLRLGSPVFLRSFKKERELELWILNKANGKFKLVHIWKIAGISGKIGPKLKEGDKQSPEGFYTVGLSQFLPSSNNHLAFNVGYPNLFDRNHGRTGSFIMVHGHVHSVGCLAMTDPFIEEIYTLCHAALTSGQQKKFQFHMYPFRMSDKNMRAYRDHPDYPFWQMLKPAYDIFESSFQPPSISIRGTEYKITSPNT